jgi:RNA recognition motif-containing protein
MNAAGARTVYIRGLPDKVRREEMRRALYLYCAQYGPVLEVHYPNTSAKHGQAWVVFPDLRCCHLCCRLMNEVMFYGKKIEVSMAKRKSFIAEPELREKRRQERIARSVVALAQRAAADYPRKRAREEETVDDAQEEDFF